LKTTRAPWDGGYHTWLEHRAVMSDFLERYAPPELLAEVDLDGLEFYKTDTYLLPDFEKRDGDMILRLPRPHHEEAAWLWLLLEVQGSQRGDMAFRALGYVHGLYLHLRRQRDQEGPFALPPVFVLVLYHGPEHWREPEDLWGLIDLPEGSPLWRFQPQLHFWLLREQQPSPLDLPLEQETNLAALLLRLNRTRNLKQLLEVLARLFGLLAQPQHHDLRPVLAAWVLQVLSKKHKLEVNKDDLAPLWQEEHMTSEPFYSTVRDELIFLGTGKTVEQLKEEWLIEVEESLTQRLEPQIAQRLESEIAQRLESEIALRLESEIKHKTWRKVVLETLTGRFGDDPRWSLLVPEALDMDALQRLWRAALAAPDKERFCADADGALKGGA
jgi:hypothetical protein